MTLWITAKSFDEPGKWELQGVFSTREKAVAACVEYRDCVFAVELDVPAPQETVHPEVFFPLAGGQ